MAAKTFRIKDWIGPVTGVAALLISATTAYFNLLRQVDDVRATLDDIPEISYTSPKTSGGLPGLAVVASPLEFAFINAGNRTAAIRSAELTIAQPYKAGSAATQFCNENAAYLKWDITPVVLKPGEMSVQKVRFSSSNSTQTAEDIRVNLRDFQAGREKYEILVCLHFIVVTPDNNAEPIYLKMYQAKIDAKELGKWAQEDLVNSKVPLRLVYNKTI